MRQPSVPVKVAAAVLLVLVGTASGAAAVLLHGQGWWGLLLAHAAAVATLLALPRGWWARLPFAAGWTVALVYALDPRPEGDFLIADGLRGYLLLVLGLVIAGWGIVSVPRRRVADDLGEVDNAS